MKKELTLEQLDKAVMLMASDCSDRQLRCVLKFKNHLEKLAIKQSIMYSLDLEQILMYGIKIGIAKVRLKKLQEDAKSLVYIYEKVQNNIEKSMASFLIEKIDIETTPMIRVGHFETDEVDYLVFKVRHEVTDSKGLLNYIKQVAKLYNKFLNLPDYNPKPYTKVNRSFKYFIKDYGFSKRMSLIKSAFADNVTDKVYSFPWAIGEGNRREVFLTEKVTIGQIDIINKFCNNNKCSYNDYILAVFYKTFFSFRNKLNSICVTYNPFYLTIDLRNYCRSRQENTLMNFSTGTFINSDIDPNVKLEYIIKEIKKRTEKFKFNIDNYKQNVIPGINTYLLFDIMSSILSYKLLSKIMQFGQKKANGLPYISIIGNIDNNVNCWNGNEVMESYMLGQIDKHPVFSLSISEYMDTLTFVIGMEGNEEDILLVKNFLNNLKLEYEKINKKYIEE